MSLSRFGQQELGDNTFISVFPQRKNFGKTYLSLAVSSIVTSLQPVDMTVFPSELPFTISVDTEIMHVIGVDSTNLFVTRGFEGTTPAAHSVGAVVVQCLTAGVLDSINATTHNYGVLASLPTEYGAGRSYLTSDAFGFYEDNGTSYRPWGPIYPLTVPDNTQFSWVNQGIATVSASGGGIFLSTGSAAGIDMKIRVKTIPSTPYTATFGFLFVILTTINNVGVLVRNSSSGKVCRTGIAQGSPSYMFLAHHPDATTTQDDLPVNQAMHLRMNQMLFYRIADDGTTRSYSFGSDGSHFQTFYTETHTNYMTPDQIGFFVETQGTTAPSTAAMTLIHYAEA